MRNAVFMLLFAGVAFGSSAAGSWFLKSKMKEPAADGETDVVSESMEPAGSGTPADANITPVSGEDLPVAVRPRPMSVEEVLRFGMGLRSREEQLKEREEALEREQSRMQLALADIRGEQQHIESLHAKLQGQADACQSILGEIEQARQALAAEREEAKKEVTSFEDILTESNEQELENIKTMSEWFRGMQPEQAAGALKKLAEEGKIDLAVQLLSNFEERDAAKVLSALDDYALMVELAERFKNYKRPPRKEARRR